MKNTAIIIPSRLEAKRFPRKPLAEIKGLPMIIHVLNRAKEAKVGEVFVATPDKEIFDLVKKSGEKAILTSDKHFSGSDRSYEVYINNIKDKVDLIINLQGDMPNIQPKSISKLEKLMRENNFSIGTLAAPIKNKSDFTNQNIVKVQVHEKLQNNNFLEAIDFFRSKKDLKNQIIYHHIGIYAFTSDALTKYVTLSRSNLEIERNLEQMRALQNNIKIGVSLSDSCPLGVDTQSDLVKVTKEMNLQ